MVRLAMGHLLKEVAGIVIKYVSEAHLLYDLHHGAYKVSSFTLLMCSLRLQTYPNHISQMLIREISPVVSLTRGCILL